MHLRCNRLVRRGQALDHVGNSTIKKPQSISRMERLCGGTQPVAVQGFVEQTAGMVTGKGSTGGVGSMLSRRKANNQKAGVTVTKRRYGPAEVIRELSFRCIKKRCETVA